MLEIFKTKIKKEFLLVGVLITAVVVIAFGSFSTKKNETQLNETQKYAEILERKLKESIESLEGVKKVSVTVQLDGGITTVIAQDQKKIEENGKITTSSSPVLVSGKPIVLGEIYPEIVGVAIVCNCENQITTKLEILDIVTTVLNLSCEKVNNGNRKHGRGRHYLRYHGIPRFLRDLRRDTADYSRNHQAEEQSQKQAALLQLTRGMTCSLYAASGLC